MKPAFLKPKKEELIIVIITLIILQSLLFLLWFNQNKEDLKLSENLHHTTNLNKIVVYSNKSNFYYFKGQNHFNKFLQYYETNELNSYKNAIDTMSLYLDSLNTASSKNPEFQKFLASKKKYENEIVPLKIKIDSIIKSGISPIIQENIGDFHYKKYDFEKVLRSIKYDSIKVSDDFVKKGLLSRIGQAIKGNYDIKKEELQVYVKMMYDDNEIKTGTIENQVKNIFFSTDKYYSNQFERLKHSYNSLRKKDNELMQINEKISEHSLYLIQLYMEATSEFNQIKIQNSISDYLSGLKKRNSQLLFILALLAIATFILILKTYNLFQSHNNN